MLFQVRFNQTFKKAQTRQHFSTDLCRQANFPLLHCRNVISTTNLRFFFARIRLESTLIQAFADKSRHDSSPFHPRSSNGQPTRSSKMETIDSKHLAEIAGNFQISGRIGDIGKLASGNIHDTYFVSTSRSEEKGFILQKINRKVFPSPEKIIENHQVLSEHLKGNRKAIDNSRLPWKIPQIVKTHTQDAFIVDRRGDFWRATEYIGNSKTYVCPSDPEIVYHVGRSLGQFHLLTSTLDITRLHRVPDGFHVTSRYYKIFLSRQKTAKNRQDEEHSIFALQSSKLWGRMSTLWKGPKLKTDCGSEQFTAIPKSRTFYSMLKRKSP